jgi:hypothetical protein
MMMTEMCNTQYEILWVKISNAVEIDSYEFPGSFQRIDAEGHVSTIGAWVVADVPDPFPKSGAWSILSVGLNGLMWVRRKCKCKCK